MDLLSTTWLLLHELAKYNVAVLYELAKYKAWLSLHKVAKYNVVLTV